MVLFLIFEGLYLRPYMPVKDAFPMAFWFR